MEINGIQVTDDQGENVTCPRTSLAVGGSMTCTGSGSAEVGQYSNNAVVTGQPVAGSGVTDNDPSHYYGTPKPPNGGGSGKIEIVKTVSPNTIKAGGILDYSLAIS